MTARSVDHLVITVHDIDEGIATWETLLGVPLTHRANHDDFGIRQAFFKLDTGFVELVAPVGDASPLAGKPEGINTVALEVDDIDAVVEELVKSGVKVVGQGTPNVVVHPKSASGVRVQLWPSDRPHRWQDAPSESPAADG